MTCLAEAQRVSGAAPTPTTPTNTSHAPRGDGEDYLGDFWVMSPHTPMLLDVSRFTETPCSGEDARKKIMEGLPNPTQSDLVRSHMAPRGMPPNSSR